MDLKSDQKVEAQRLKALRDYEVLDLINDPELNDLTQLASVVCGTPMALISFVEKSKIFFTSCVGVQLEEIPRENSFCEVTIEGHSPFVISDIQLDKKFCRHPLVPGEPHLRFYAGTPLKTSSGLNIGTVCTLDYVPRTLSESQLTSLESISRLVMTAIEKRRLQKRLTERENFLSNIMEVHPCFVAYLDTDLRYLYANKAHAEMLLVQEQEIIGQRPKDIIGEKAFAKAEPYLKKALAGERVEYFAEMPYSIRGETSLRSMHIFYIPNKNSKNKVIGVYVIALDVSELREAERKSRSRGEQLKKLLEKVTKNENSLRALFDNSPLGMAQLNSQLDCITSNWALQKILGYSEIEMRKINMLDITHPDDRAMSSHLRQETAEFLKPLVRLQKRYIRKDGQVIWILVSSNLVFDKELEEITYFSVFEDITEIRKREEELETARAKMVASSRMAELGEMAGGIAHEINNPLTVIQGKARLMVRRIGNHEMTDEKMISELEKISNTADRIGKIVSGLRLFSRDSSQDPQVPALLSKIAEDTLEFCRERMRHHEIDIRVEIDPSIFIRCRAAQISQVLLNLLNNSFDALANKEGSWVELKATITGDRVLISVKDSGNGIPDIIMDKIMQPFFTTKEVGKGTGLGLSISNGIVEEHGGTLKLDRDCPNTCFVIDLPRLLATESVQSSQRQM